MKLFETESLIVKTLEKKDQQCFSELLSNPKIIKPIPQAKFTKKQLVEKFNEFLNMEEHILQNEKYVCGIFEKGNSKMIGLCLFLTNDENDNEIGYRFRDDYWGKGYGTETAKAMIDYYFDVLKFNKVTADVNIENIGSVKILRKFMKPVSEFYNKKANCTNRRYEVNKENWGHNQFK